MLILEANVKSLFMLSTLVLRLYINKYKDKIIAEVRINGYKEAQRECLPEKIRRNLSIELSCES